MDISTAFSRSSRPEVFCKNGIHRNFAKFTGKHTCQSLFFNKVADLRPATLLKKRIWHRCFPVNLAVNNTFFYWTPPVAASYASAATQWQIWDLKCKVANNCLNVCNRAEVVEMSKDGPLPSTVALCIVSVLTIFW